MAELGRSMNRFFSLGRLRSKAAHTAAWEAHFYAGMIACREGRLGEAMAEYGAALQEAEGFPEGDLRLAVSLSNLVAIYRLQGKHAEAESICRRALALKESALGPADPE